MCYKCEVCNSLSLPKEIRNTYRIMKPDGNIYQEHTVCRKCLHLLDQGADFKSLVEEHRRYRGEDPACPPRSTSGNVPARSNKPGPTGLAPRRHRVH